MNVWSKQSWRERIVYTAFYPLEEEANIVQAKAKYILYPGQCGKRTLIAVLIIVADVLYCLPDTLYLCEGKGFSSNNNCFQA